MNSDNPYQGVDPATYSLQTQATIHYVGAGDLTPQDRIQTAYWHRDITVNNNQRRQVY